MKKYLITAMISALGFCTNVTAQDGSHAFLKEGKVWNCVLQYGPDGNTEYYKNIIRGDSVVNGITYFKMYRETDTESELDFYALWREDEGKVYTYVPSEGKERLMYDFSAQPESEVFCEGRNRQVKAVGKVTAGEQRFNCLSIFVSDGFLITWVEGVGSPYGPGYPIGPMLSNGKITTLLSCYEDGRLIFEATDFNKAFKADVKIDETTFPDKDFRNWVLAQEYGKDGVLTAEEIAGVTFVNLLAQNIIAKGNIHSLKGIEHFTAMTKLVCSRNELTELDLSKNTALTWLECYGNHLTELDLSKNTKLTHLDCQSNELTALNVSGCTHLTELDCFGNQLTMLNVSGCNALTILKCYLNPLMELDVSGCTSLTTMWVFDNQLRVLDVSDCNSLSNLWCSNNQLTQLDVSKNTMLTELRCEDNHLTALDLSKNKNLNSLRTYHNPIKGEAMDILIESLPTVSRGDWSVIRSEDEEGVVTTTQVAAAKAKGWISYYWNEAAKSWMEYAGSETTQDDYRPFVVVGKKWDMIRSDFDGNYHHISYRLTNEKVEKAGKTYMRMCRREDYLTVADDEELLREENRKVYIFDSDMQKEFLLFDYSLKAGDTYETYSYDDQKMVSYKVVSVSNFTDGPESIRYDYDEERDSMIMQRRYLRKWKVYRTDDNSLQKTWIESIGSLEGPLANLYVRPISFKDDLAYVEDNYYYYLPFSFHNEFSHVHGCNLPTGAEDYKEDDERHKLTYELEGDRLHIYGKAFTQCGPNNYAYFYEKKTDDPLVNKIEFVIQEAEPMADCMALHATNFYVPGFDPNMNYIVIDNQGEEHPVINKTPQMDYRPFVEEGKVWKVGAISSNPVQVVDYFYFDGDTIIDGKTCKVMMCQRCVSPDFSNEYWKPTPSLNKVGAWYEEDKKVYFYEDILHFMRMKYDFSLGANDTLQLFDTNSLFILGPKQTEGIKGFKGVYREVMLCDDEGQTFDMATWLEGVGGLMGPIRDDYNDAGDGASFLMSCTVGDEVIYLNDEHEDGATPEGMGARKNRFDFTHTIKTKPKAPKRSQEKQSLYGEYNDLKLGINLNPLDDAYQVRITDESGKVVYEKAVNTNNIVGLDIDISAYAKGRYTVTVENSDESFTGEFNAQITGIEVIINNKVETRNVIYNLQGQRLSSLQKGLNIVNGQKIYVK